MTPQTGRLNQRIPKPLLKLFNPDRSAKKLQLAITEYNSILQRHKNINRREYARHLIHLGDELAKLGEYNLAHSIFYSRVSLYGNGAGGRNDEEGDGNSSNILSDSLIVDEERDHEWRRLEVEAKVKGLVCEWKGHGDLIIRNEADVEVWVDKSVGCIETLSEIWGIVRECMIDAVEWLMRVRNFKVRNVDNFQKVVDFMKRINMVVDEEEIVLRLFDNYLEFTYKVQASEEMDEFISSENAKRVDLVKIIKTVYDLKNESLEIKTDERKFFEKFKTVKYIEENDEQRKLYERCLGLQSLIERTLPSLNDVFACCLLYLHKGFSQYKQEIVAIAENVRQGYPSDNFYLMRFKNQRIVEGEELVLKDFELLQFEKLKERIEKDTITCSSTLQMIEENNFDRRVTFADERRIPDPLDFYTCCLQKHIPPHLLEKLFNECYKQSSDKLELLAGFIGYVESWSLSGEDGTLHEYGMFLSELYDRLCTLMIGQGMECELEEICGWCWQKRVLMMTAMWRVNGDVMHLKQAFKIFTKHHVEQKLDGELYTIGMWEFCC
ncbi:hypothetical protein O9G_005773 [Rozella allomycis CSF55]|uniref:Uncharacterized protein n=1 Tax=Rozella allomycis (strain CSF55) TaxID=988480 RepID=A0A075AQS4_ROZAC|nr:hypothetical protein O9G_005773 [Rozella allomycis CSF55]|eukprot:EPZ30942.1 hypothetical protein O9G_005773 [Rozella allomycis CSF55]